MWSPGDLPCVEDVYIAPRNQSYNEAERSINPVLHLLWFFVIRTLRCALKFSTFRCRLHPVQQMSPLSQFSCTTGEGMTIIDARFPILPWIDLLSAIDSNRKRSVACLESWITLLLWLVKNYISLYRVYYCIANSVQRVFSISRSICIIIKYLVYNYYMHSVVFTSTAFIIPTISFTAFNRFCHSGFPFDCWLYWTVIFLGSATRHLCYGILCGTCAERCRFCTCSQWLW